MANSNQSLTDTPTKPSDTLDDRKPLNLLGNFHIGDVVRVKEGKQRANIVAFIRENIGKISKIESRFDRVHCPFKLEGISPCFYPDELELVAANVDGKEITLPVVRSTVPSIVYPIRNYGSTPSEPKPKVVYWDIKEVSQ